MTERNDGTTEQSPPEKGASWKRFRSGPLPSEKRFCGTIPSKGAYLEKGCQLFAGMWQKKNPFESDKKGWRWGVRTVFTSEWWNGARTVNYRILEWRGGEVVILLRSGLSVSWNGVLKWRPRMVSWNGLCLGIMKRCLVMVIQDMSARYVKTELSARICRFVKTVSVKVWFAQNSLNGIGMMPGFHRCCGINNPAKLVVLNIW